MTHAELLCPDCRAAYEAADNYCRQCGMYLAALRDATAITVTETRSLARHERPRASLPAPVRRAATAVAVGAALQVGVSLAGKYLAAQAARKAMDSAVAAPRKRGKRAATTRAEPRQEAQPVVPDGVAAVSETLLIRRVWVRRP